MNSHSEKDISLLGLLISFSFLGVIAIIGIVMWQRGDTIDFLVALFSLENFIRNLLIGILIGLVMTLFIIALVKITKTKLPSNKYTKLLKVLMLQPFGPIVVGILPGIFEELLFRGFLLPLSMSFIGTHWAVIVTSLIFCALHIPQYRNSWIVNVSVLVLSIVLSYVFVITETIWAPIVIHTVYNFSVSYLMRKGTIEFYEVEEN